jgi:hypothetical protein
MAIKIVQAILHTDGYDMVLHDTVSNERVRCVDALYNVFIDEEGIMESVFEDWKALANAGEWGYEIIK